MPTKAKAKTDDEEVEAESADKDEIDPHRFAGLAQPPLSDPAHPEHLEWHHEHAGGPDPDELPAIKEQQEADAEAAAEAAQAAAEKEAAEAEAAG